MRTMGKMDASIQGWYIDPAEVSICKRPEDGEDWLLGTGSYGKVGHCWLAAVPCWPSCAHPWQLLSALCSTSS